MKNLRLFLVCLAITLIFIAGTTLATLPSMEDGVGFFELNCIKEISITIFFALLVLGISTMLISRSNLDNNS